jgi:hypothetical protein
MEETTMERSHSGEIDQISRLLFYPKVHYRVFYPEVDGSSLYLHTIFRTKHNFLRFHTNKHQHDYGQARSSD